MNVATFTGTVENGQIRLTGDVRLPENATVFVVVPGLQPVTASIISPRLARPEQAADFVKRVVEEPRVRLAKVEGLLFV